MFTISPQHVLAFEKNGHERFIEELALNSYDFIADPPPFLTPKERLSAARLVFKSAEKAGYETRGACFFWLNMAVLFGAHFADDPQYDVMAFRRMQQSEVHEITYLTQVYENVSDYVSKVFGGKTNSIYTKALWNFLALLDEPDISEILSKGGGIAWQLQSLYPEKYNAHSNIYLSKVKNHIFDDKAQHLLGSKHALAVFFVAGMEMFFGHRFEYDMFKPWIGTTLKECAASTAGSAPDLKLLTDKLRVWLDIERDN